jgi:hypothetical protein
LALRTAGGVTHWAAKIAVVANFYECKAGMLLVIST